MKFNLTAACLVVIATALPAQANDRADDWADDLGDRRAAFEGAYAGVQAGGGTTDVTLILGGVGIGDVSLASIEGGVFAGYALRHDRFVGGVELEGVYVGGSDEVDAPFGNAEVETRGAVGASLIAGVVVADEVPAIALGEGGGSVMLYGRVGYRALFAKIDAAGDAGTDAFHGLRAGGGVAVQLTDNLALRAEYTRVQYREQRYGGGRNTLTVGPSGNLASIGLSWRF
ncbi:MAG: outer membrane beta-barrel protein [Pseudomonadota bacterium]